ncbi:MAG: L17 family ribosomal protein [Eubacteriales bacterium]|nr:L17 family ribosomal protein [Eubacteriales bacterium]
MAMYRKLGKTSSQRKALLRNQVTALLYHGKIITTEARAKEIRKIAEKLIALGVKEKDNFEEVEVTCKVAKKENGKRVKETKVINGVEKKVTVYDEVKKTIKKDKPSKLHARRQMLKVLYDVTEVPSKAQGRKAGTKQADLANKIFDEYGTKYAKRNGGYTRIVKIGQRKGDGAMEVLIELV